MSASAGELISASLDGNILRTWHQELAFLSEIDTYRYNRFYLLPLINQTLSGGKYPLPESIPDGNLKAVRRILGKMDIGFDMNNAHASPQVVYHISTDIITRRFVNSFWGLSCKEVIEAVRTGILKPITVEKDTDKPGWVRLSIDAIIDQGYLHAELITVLNRRFKEIYRQGQTIERALHEQEDDKLLNAVLEI